MHDVLWVRTQVLGSIEFWGKLETAAKGKAAQAGTGQTAQTLNATLRNAGIILPVMGNRDRRYEKELVT